MIVWNNDQAIFTPIMTDQDTAGTTGTISTTAIITIGITVRGTIRGVPPPTGTTGGIVTQLSQHLV
jgi:hypothetical protein